VEGPNSFCLREGFDLKFDPAWSCPLLKGAASSLWLGLLTGFKLLFIMTHQLHPPPFRMQFVLGQRIGQCNGKLDRFAGCSFSARRLVCFGYRLWPVQQ
jgi:hypothetical protein